MTTFGPFSLICLLGQGGIAHVYKAWWRRRHAVVALKVLRPSLARDDLAISLFHREAWLTGVLHHPHIVRVYERGQANDCAYIAMQYCSRGSLSDALHRGRLPLPWSLAVAVICQIGAALHYAHTQNIVHGDVKPSNILFGPDGRALLSDFGVASLTRQPARGGTPGYAAPEQAASGPVDRRTDVYGLAAVVIAMLAGEDALWSADPWVMSFPAGVPARVRAILARARDPDPSRRFPSVTDLVGNLAGCWIANRR